MFLNKPATSSTMRKAIILGACLVALTTGCASREEEQRQQHAYIQTEINRQLSAILIDSTDSASKRILELTKSYLSSPGYQEQLKRDVNRDLEALLPKEDEVLVLKPEQFKRFGETHNLVGPIATIESMAESSYENTHLGSIEGAYSRAFNKLKKQARAKNGNVVEIVDEKLSQPGRLVYTASLTGNLYRLPNN